MFQNDSIQRVVLFFHHTSKLFEPRGVDGFTVQLTEGNEGVHGFWKGIVLIHCYGVLPDFFQISPLKTRMTLEKSPFLIGDTSSTSCSSSVMLVFGGVNVCFYKRAKRAHRKKIA